MAAKVSLGFATLPDTQLDNFAQGVINKMTGHPKFPTPPVTMAALGTAKTDFSTRIAAAKAGGPADTAAKNSSRQTLVSMLRQLASYVQMICLDDLALLLESGFEAQSTNRARLELGKPEGLTIKNGPSGSLIASITPVKNTYMYEGRSKAANGDWMASVFTGDSQHIIFEGLTPGVVYTIQVRSLGGAKGHSDWSDPSSHMAM